MILLNVSFRTWNPSPPEESTKENNWFSHHWRLLLEKHQEKTSNKYLFSQLLQMFMCCAIADSLLLSYYLVTKNILHVNGMSYNLSVMRRYEGKLIVWQIFFKHVSTVIFQTHFPSLHNINSQSESDESIYIYRYFMRGSFKESFKIQPSLVAMDTIETRKVSYSIGVHTDNLLSEAVFFLSTYKFCLKLTCLIWIPYQN